MKIAVFFSTAWFGITDREARRRRYLDRHGWDIVEYEEWWRAHQRRRTAEEDHGDKW